MALRLFIKQNPIYGKVGSSYGELHYKGPNPQSLEQEAGGLPAGSSRRWPNYGSPIDVTEYVSDIHKLKLEWSANRDDSGNVAAGELRPVKGVSGSLTFERLGYDLLKAWLVDDVSASQNSVEVSLQDTECSWYTGYLVKADDLTWCEGDICTYSVTLKQQNEQLNCIKRTMITDNHLGWFPPQGAVPAGGKKHPRFSYCNEVRPNGLLIMDWFNAATNGLVTYLLVFSLGPIINSILFILNLVNNFIQFLGGGGFTVPGYITPSGLLENYQQYYVESAGCGREHPAPLIRDYIYNVCEACKIKVDAASAPIFFSEQLEVDTSSRGKLTLPNPHYNACYLNASTRRGIRRFDSLSIFNLQDANTTDFWVHENGPLLMLDQFLDEIKGMYNAEWRLLNGTLYFHRKDHFIYNQDVYDMRHGSPHRDKIVEGICYTPNDNKYFASVNGIYQPDPSDTCGNEAGNENGSGQMNGIANFGKTDNNPNFSGVLQKAQKFGATKFRLDGASTDYIYDAMQVVVNGGLFTPFLPGLMRDFVSKAIREYCDYALLLSGETAVQPKIIIWSGDSYLNAKAIKPKAAWDGLAPQPVPDINPTYNTELVPWKLRHDPQTFVIGSSLSFAQTPKGMYKVKDYFGITITENPAILCNYPMYFEPYYLDTLWDWFHWIDDPRRNPRLNKDWRLKIRYCCDDAEWLGLTNDASGIKLLQRVMLPLGYHQEGHLKEIELSFDPTDEYGQYIELRGDV